MTDKQKYREFCKTEKNIPIFSKDWWLDSVCGEDDWDVVLVEKGEEIFASLPYYKTKKVIFDMILMPKLTQTMGVYTKYPPRQKYEKRLSYEKDIINTLIQNMENFHYFSQSFHYSFTNWLPFYWQGYNQTTRYTYVIENLLKIDEDSILQNFNSSYRNKIKKALRLVDICSDMNIEDFYNINKKTFIRQNIDIPYNKEFIIRHDSILNSHNARKIFYAKDNNKNIHSALYLTWDSTSSYVHMVGEDPELRNSGAGILLIWEAIKFTKNILKLDNFDFEGSMIENVEQVRRSFGAIQKPYFTISKTNSKLLKTRRLIKEIF